MNRKYLIGIAILVSLQACKSKNTETTTDPIITTETVKIAHAFEGEYLPTLECTGTFYAYQEANLGTALPGKVEKIYFPKGTYVKEGDLLVELSQELLTQAMIENIVTKTDFGRIKRLREKGSVTTQDYDHLKAKLDASNEKVKLLKINTEIRAPFSGVIAGYMVQEGENYLFSPNLKAGYSMTSGIVSLMQTDRLILKIDVNEKDIPQIKQGLKVSVSTDVYPDIDFEGTVMLIEPSLNVLTHTANTEILVDNKNYKLKPGMFGHASVKLLERKEMFILQEAILRQAGTGINFIYHVEDGRVQQKEVKIRSYVGTNVLIDPIQDDLQIITSGKNKVQVGTLVKIVK